MLHRLRPTAASALIAALSLAPPLALGGALAGGCTPTARATRTAVPRTTALAGLPPRQDPPIDLTDDDDLDRARNEFLALDLGDPARSARRSELWGAYRARIDRTLDNGRAEDALRLFRLALGMWDPGELAEPSQPSADLAGPAEVAARLYPRAARSGDTAQAMTALAVLIAARPGETARFQATYDQMSAYLDALAVAEHGEGAENARQIKALEELLVHFPSRWATDTLVRLYLDRQATLQQRVQNPQVSLAPGLFAGHGALIQWPTWNLVRAYALAGRLADAMPVVDGLAGQLGDQPPVRERLRAALASRADGLSWVALAAAFAPSRERPEAPSDLTAMYRICVLGARQAPRAAEPAACAGEAAARAEHIPLALRWLEDAASLSPGDRDIADFLARLLHVRLAEKVQAERLDAARNELARVETFYAGATRRWPKKPLEIPLARAYLTMGRGLYNVGEIDQAARYFTRAQKLDPSPDALEQLGTIHHKRGRYSAAARELEAAAELSLRAPGDARLDRPRLLREAADALLEGGQPARARALFAEALHDADLQLRDRPLGQSDRSILFGERGRLLYALGDPEQARRAFEASVDSAPEEASSYANLIAFLLTRGHYDPALDAFHRALGRTSVVDYFKVYTSIWITAFARLRGVEPDPLALEYLRSCSGQRWQHQLARFATGAIDYPALLRQADTRGKRAEAYFYRALDRLAHHDRAGAEAMLRMVLGTDMFGFFEYDMALYLLKNGLPK